MALANSIRVGLTGAMSTLAREVGGAGHHGQQHPARPDGYRRAAAGDRCAGAVSRTAARDAVRQDMAASIPTGRLGAADDFGPLCAFLCSRHANYITAQNIAVDGGLVRGLI